MEANPRHDSSVLRGATLCACVLAIAVLSCGSATSASRTAGTSGTHDTPYLLLSADPKTRNDPRAPANVMLLAWRGDFRDDARGIVLALVDARGYAGLLRVRGPSDVDCDDCGGPLVEAEVIDGRTCTDCVAFGPVASAPRAIRWSARNGAPPLSNDWAAGPAVDEDGDGRFDFEEVSRCGHETHSGCSDLVCDQSCVGLRRATEREPLAKSVVCGSFIPDLEDCEPR